MVGGIACCKSNGFWQATPALKCCCHFQAVISDSGPDVPRPIYRIKIYERSLVVSGQLISFPIQLCPSALVLRALLTMPLTSLTQTCKSLQDPSLTLLLENSSDSAPTYSSIIIN